MNSDDVAYMIKAELSQMLSRRVRLIPKNPKFSADMKSVIWQTLKTGSSRKPKGTLVTKQIDTGLVYRILRGRDNDLTLREIISKYSEIDRSELEKNIRDFE